MKTNRVLSVLAAIALLANLMPVRATARAYTAVPSRILYVKEGFNGGCTSWADACGLKKALKDVAKTGDQIWVAAGTYKPTTNSQDRSASFVLKDGVAVFGGFPASGGDWAARSPQDNLTVLSGDILGNDQDGFSNAADNVHHVVLAIDLGRSVTLDGFTIRGGNADMDVDHWGWGGGMYIFNSSLTIRNVLFTNNQAYGGGGLFVDGIHADGTSPLLKQVQFVSNRGNVNGGGMHTYHGSRPMLTDVTFTSNLANVHGGGMYNLGSCSPTLVRSRFDRNRASKDGGAMYNEDKSSPALVDASFTTNTAGRDGAGMANVDNSSPTLLRVTFSGNEAARDGGGMFNYSNSSPALTNVTFSNNSALMDGGGIYNSILSAAQLVHATFTGNSAGYRGGGIIAYNTETYVVNSIVWGNTAPQDPQFNIMGGGVNFTHSIIQDFAFGEGNSSDNPLLKPLEDNGGFSLTHALQEGSPAVDSAGAILCPFGDQREMPRSFDGNADGQPKCDMGAYEYWPPSTVAGRATDPDGNGLQGVTIRLVSATTIIFLPFIAKAAAQTRPAGDDSQPAAVPQQPSATAPVMANAAFITILTDANGYYSFVNLQADQYTASAALYGVEFTPTEKVLDLPGVGVANFQVKIIDPVIPVTTKTLSYDALNAMQSVSPDMSEIRFAKTNALAVVPGDIMVSEPTHAAPDGLLRKVTGVTETADSLVVTTAPATLEEAVQEGDVFNSDEMTTEDIESSNSLSGVELESVKPLAGSLVDFSLTLKDVVLYDEDNSALTKNDQIRANGSIDFTLDITFGLKIRRFKLEKMTFINTNKLTKELEIVTTKSLAKKGGDVTLATIKLRSIKFWVGSVPVLFKPELEIIAGMDGSVEVGISTSVTQEYTLVAGFQYNQGKWETIGSFDRHFNFTPPHPTLNFTLRGYTGVRLTFFLYGVAGPHISVLPFLEVSIDIDKIIFQPDDYWWTLHVGIAVKTGFQVRDEKTNEVLNLDKCELTVIEVKWLLAHSKVGNQKPAAPHSPSPPQGSANQSPHVKLAWQASDPDGDIPLTYDVFFGKANPPTIKVKGSQWANSFDPGLLDTASTYYWRVVVWDSAGATQSGPVWSFTTTNSPPLQPSTPSPASNSVVERNQVSLSWTGGDPDPTDSVTYTVYLDKNTNPTTPVCANHAAASCAVSGLAPETQYYWKVAARDKLGAVTLGMVWSFTTGAFPIPGEMVNIPAGDFQMGCNEGYYSNYSCSSNASPQHTVTLSAYRIDKYEVTNGQYAQCVSAGVCQTPRELSSGEITSYYGNPAFDLYPVINVTWEDADRYCTWAGRRLPTEAEWEKAARGPDARTYPWGNELPWGCDRANLYPCYKTNPEPIGSYPAGASPYGVKDLIGNVWEWVKDWYQADYYSISPPTDPAGPSTGDAHVLRGGGFITFPDQAYVMNREISEERYFSNDIGFRCAAGPTP